MIRDFVILLGMEWKRGKVGVIRWLKVIGFDPNGSKLYHLYFWLFWAFWLFAMWAYTVEQVYQLSITLPTSTESSFFKAIPVIIFAAQMLYLYIILRDEPLKLPEDTLVYVAFSPLNRASIVSLEFMRSLLLPTGFVAIISCLLAMLLSWRSMPDQVGIAGLGALLIAILLVYFSAALAWALALWKIQPSMQRVRHFFWLALPIAVVAVGTAPNIMFFPGYVWQHVAHLSLSVADLIGLLMGLIVSSVFLHVAGSRVHMSVIADASQTAVRIHRLGVLGRFYATDAISQIQHQAHLTHSKQLSTKLSERATGHGVLWSRADLAIRRLLPGSVVQPLLLGSSLTLMITTIVRVGGWHSIQVWVLVLLLLCTFRLKNIITLFRQDVTQPFLRQLIPTNNLAIFIADSSYSLIFNTIASVTVIGLQPWDSTLVVMILGLLSVTALGQCQALELVEERLILHRRIPFEYAVMLCGAVVITLGVASQSLVIAVIALLVVNSFLSVLLYYSRT